MDVREKLAEILENKDNEPMQSYLDEADYLVAHGVTVQELHQLRSEDEQLTILRRGGVNYKVGKVQQEANATNDVVDSEFSTF